MVIQVLSGSISGSLFLFSRILMSFSAHYAYWSASLNFASETTGSDNGKPAASVLVESTRAAAANVGAIRACSHREPLTVMSYHLFYTAPGHDHSDVDWMHLKIIFKVVYILIR